MIKKYYERPLIHYTILAVQPGTAMTAKGLRRRKPPFSFLEETRYHHLVRLGGDIERAGLGEYPKATLLGSLLIYRDEQD